MEGPVGGLVSFLVKETEVIMFVIDMLNDGELFLNLGAILVFQYCLENGDDRPTYMTREY